MSRRESASERQSKVEELAEEYGVFSEDAYDYNIYDAVYDDVEEESGEFLSTIQSKRRDRNPNYQNYESSYGHSSYSSYDEPQRRGIPPIVYIVVVIVIAVIAYFVFF